MEVWRNYFFGQTFENYETWNMMQILFFFQSKEINYINGRKQPITRRSKISSWKIQTWE